MNKATFLAGRVERRGAQLGARSVHFARRLASCNSLFLRREGSPASRGETVAHCVPIPSLSLLSTRTAPVLIHASLCFPLKRQSSAVDRTLGRRPWLSPPAPCGQGPPSTTSAASPTAPPSEQSLFPLRPQPQILPRRIDDDSDAVRRGLHGASSKFAPSLLLHHLPLGRQGLLPLLPHLTSLVFPVSQQAVPAP